jgi:hypothetical protein
MMKLKEGFMTRSIAGSTIVVPVGEKVVNFKGIMNLNETGAYIFEQLKEEISFEELLSCLLLEYEVEEETLRKDLNEFLENAKSIGII